MLIIRFSLASNVYKRFVGIQLLLSRTTSTKEIAQRQRNRYIMTTNTGQKIIQLSDIDVLARPNCKIKDRERVELIINEIINGGNHELQVVTDFDYTLTKQKTDDGKPVLSSFGMFNKCKSLPQSYKIESKRLYEKYRPIEICPRITHDEKRQHMIDWWGRSSDILK